MANEVIPNPVKTQTLQFNTGFSYQTLQPYFDKKFLTPQETNSLSKLLSSANSIYEIIDLENKDIKIKELFSLISLDNFWLDILKNPQKLLQNLKLNENSSIFINTMVTQKGMRPYDLLAGLALFQKAQTIQNNVEKIELLKSAAEKYHSFHAATHYFTLQLNQILEIESSQAKNASIENLTTWYLGCAKIHGSPAYANLALSFLHLSQQNPEYAKKSKIYAEVAVKLEKLSAESRQNAYFGQGMGITNQLGINSFTVLRNQNAYALTIEDNTTINNMVLDYSSHLQKSNPALSSISLSIDL